MPERISDADVAAAFIMGSQSPAKTTGLGALESQRLGGGGGATMMAAAIGEKWKKDAQESINEMQREGRYRVKLWQFQEYLMTEKGLATACSTLPFTIVLWISFFLLQSVHTDVTGSFQTRVGISHEFDTRNVTRSMVSTGEGGDQESQWKNFREFNLMILNDIQELNLWMKYALVPIISLPNEGILVAPLGSSTTATTGTSSVAKTSEKTNDPGAGMISSYNKLVGAVRIQQLRAKSGLCDVDSELRKAILMNVTCHETISGDSDYSTDTPTNMPKGVDSYDVAFKGGSMLKGVEPYKFVAWLLTGHTTSLNQERIDSLINNFWLDQNTLSVIIQGTLYNGQTQMYSLMSIHVEFMKSGVLKTKNDVRTIKSDLYPTIMEWFPDLFFLFLCSVLLIQEIRQMKQDWQDGYFSNYLRDYWNWLDWVGIIIGSTIVFSYWAQYVWLSDFEDMIKNLPKVPEKIPLASTTKNQREALILANLPIQEATAEILDRMESIIEFKVVSDLQFFWYNVILMLRFFKGFRGQPRISVILEVFNRASKDFSHFLVIFVVVFMNYAAAGFCMYGVYLEEYSTFSQSIEALFGMLFGESQFYRMYEISPLTSVFFFWSFVIAFVFLILNMLLAIVVDNYVHVKKVTGEGGKGMYQQLLDFMDNIRWSRSYEGSKKSAPIDTLLVKTVLAQDPSDRKNAVAMRSRGVWGFKIDRFKNLNKSLMSEREVTVDWLVANGCDELNAHRLLSKCKQQLLNERAVFSEFEFLIKSMENEFTRCQLRMARLANNMNAAEAEMMGNYDIASQRLNQIQQYLDRIRNSQEMPDGWKEYYDEREDKIYYIDRQGRTVWALPKDALKDRKVKAIKSAVQKIQSVAKLKSIGTIQDLNL